MTLTAITPADTTWLWDVLGHWRGSYRWSLRGQTPSPELLGQLLWTSVMIQNLWRREDGTPAGLLQLYDGNLDSGIAALGFIFDPAESQRFASALDAFLDHSFREFPLRKVYVELLEDEFSDLSLIGQRVQLAGRLEAHERRGQDRFCDLLLYELWRNDS